MSELDKPCDFVVDVEERLKRAEGALEIHSWFFVAIAVILIVLSVVGTAAR